MAATIRDISKMTGLALATVSKYLNGGNVLPQNRVLIEQAIKELHYEVNEVARGLATNRTRTIGILTHRLDNIFASTIITEIEDILRRNDYGTIVCGCRGDEELEEQALRFLLSKRVDGIISIPTAQNPDYLKPAFDRNVPVVLIDRSFEMEPASGDQNLQTPDCVLVDNEKASFEAVRKLMEFGHERIGIITGKSTTYTAKKRLEGYERAFSQAGLETDPQLIKQGPMMETTFGYRAMKELLSLPKRPTAVFLTNYEITLGGIIALNEEGLRIPDDISIIGFDNMNISQVVNPKLWMISQPVDQIAREAAQLMLQRLKGEKKEGGTRIVLDTMMHEGASISYLK